MLRLIDCDEDLKEDYTGIGIQECLAYAFARHAESFNILARYEARIERSFYRALHELQRLKAGRAGQPVPPPQVVEVNSPENEEVSATLGIVPSTYPTSAEPCSAKPATGLQDAEKRRLAPPPQADAESCSPGPRAWTLRRGAPERLGA